MAKKGEKTKGRLRNFRFTEEVSAWLDEEHDNTGLTATRIIEDLVMAVKRSKGEFGKPITATKSAGSAKAYLKIGDRGTK
jgi:hypothetical protein